MSVSFGLARSAAGARRRGGAARGGVLRRIGRRRGLEGTKELLALFLLRQGVLTPG